MSIHTSENMSIHTSINTSVTCLPAISTMRIPTCTPPIPHGHNTSRQQRVIIFNSLFQPAMPYYSR